MNCNICGKPLKDGAKFCTGCGAPVKVLSPERDYFNDNDTHICPQCGRELAAGVMFCKYCGCKIGKADNFGDAKTVRYVENIPGHDWNQPERGSTQQVLPAKKKKSPLPIILGILMAVILLVVVGVVLYFVKSKGESKEESTETTTEQVSSASTDTETTEDPILSVPATESPAVQYPDGVREEYITNASCNINNNLEKSEFQYAESPDGSYHFYYPKHLYNTFNYDDNSGFYFAYIDEYGNTVTSLRVYTQPCIGDIRTNAQNLKTAFINRLDTCGMKYPSDVKKKKIGDDGILQVIVSGWQDGTKTQGSYLLGGNDGNKNYIFEVVYPDRDPTNDFEDWDYIVNTIYRYCSFSGTEKAVYTNYDAFFEGETKNQ